MFNVRRGAVALAFVATMCAADIASAQQMTITKFSFELTQVLETCGADGIPNNGDGNFVIITGTADIVDYVKPAGIGEWSVRTRFTASGTGQLGTDNYTLHLSQTSNFNLASFGETMLLGKTMLIRQGEDGTPDDIVAKVYVNVRADGNGNPTVNLGKFEAECR